MCHQIRELHLGASRELHRILRAVLLRREEAHQSRRGALRRLEVLRRRGEDRQTHQEVLLRRQEVLLHQEEVLHQEAHQSHRGALRRSRRGCHLDCRPEELLDPHRIRPAVHQEEAHPYPQEVRLQVRLP